MPENRLAGSSFLAENRFNNEKLSTAFTNDREGIPYFIGLFFTTPIRQFDELKDG